MVKLRCWVSARTTFLDMQNSPQAAEESSLVAAIVDHNGISIDALLAEVVREQQAIGLRVRGLLMRRPPRQVGCSPSMLLVDIETGDDYLVSQPMGESSKSCRADPQGFARASQVFRNALVEAPDLIVSNRFGDLEVQRGGFMSELLDVMQREIPLLTTVAERNVSAWQEFTGGSTLLPPDAAQLTAWIRNAVCQRQLAGVRWANPGPRERGARAEYFC
jgi:nucleoside-triphosphatase THEP1